MPATTEATPNARPGFVGGINYDHPGGVVIKTGRVLDPTRKDKHGDAIIVDGMGVCMYKDNPGIYFAENGRQLTEAHAKAAGYDVDKMRKLRERKKFMDASLARFDASNALSGERTVVASRDGIQVVDLGGGRHVLEDVASGPEPYNLTPNRHLSREEAMEEFNRFFGEDAAGEPSVDGGAGNPAPQPKQPEPPMFRKVGSK